MRVLLTILVFGFALQGVGQEKVVLNKKKLKGEWLQYAPEGIEGSLIQRTGHTITFKMNGRYISKWNSRVQNVQVGTYTINEENKTIEITKHVKDHKPQPDFSSWTTRTYEMKVVKINDDELEVIYIDTVYYKRVKN